MTVPPDTGIEISENPTSREKLYIFLVSIVRGLDFFSMVKHRDIVVRENGRIIGFVRLKYFRDFVEVGNLYVRKSHRGSRVPRCLWSAVKNGCPETKIYAMSRRRLSLGLRRLGFRTAEGEIPPILKLRWFISRPIGKVLRFDFDLLVYQPPISPPDRLTQKANS